MNNDNVEQKKYYQKNNRGNSHQYKKLTPAHNVCIIKDLFNFVNDKFCRTNKIIYPLVLFS